MFDAVKWILRFYYYYSRIVGAINFEIDLGNGRASVSKLASIYAVLVNCLVLGAIMFLSRSHLVGILWSHASLLHEYIFVIMNGIQIICIMITIISHWLQRHRLINLINAFCLLACRKPQVMRVWRKRVIIKFLSVSLSELVQTAVSFVFNQKYFPVDGILMVPLMYALTTFTNMIGSHYHLIMLNVHSHYILLNQEIQTVLDKIYCLENEQRKAAFMMKCCSLADQLEDIARAQSHLQKLVDNIVQIFSLQGFCFLSIYYFSTIAGVYFTFASRCSNGGECNIYSTMGYVFVMVCYCTDAIITIDNFYIVLDEHAAMVRLLEDCSTFAPGLDVRLEQVIESFQLQLKQNPLKIRLLDFYDLKRSALIATASSIVTNSLVLIQYELKNL